MKDKLYKIKELESISGVKAHTIRIWEKRYKLLNPIRTGTNIRRYTHEDFKKLINISILYNFGWKISKIAELDEDAIHLHCEEAIEKKTGSYPEMTELLLSIDSLDLARFEDLLNDFKEKFGVEKVVYSILAPLCERLEIMSMLNRIESTVEEYFLNRIYTMLLEWCGEYNIQLNNHSKNILLLQSDTNSIPTTLAMAMLLSKTKSHNAIYFGKVVKNEFLKGIKKIITPDVVLTEFSKPTSDHLLAKRIKALSKAFKQSYIYITGKKATFALGELPENVFYIENIRDFYRTV